MRVHRYLLGVKTKRTAAAEREEEALLIKFNTLQHRMQALESVQHSYVRGIEGMARTVTGTCIGQLVLRILNARGRRNQEAAHSFAGC